VRLGQRGFSTVLQLVALAMVLLAFAAMAAIVLFASRLYEKSESLNQMLVAETALLSWVSDRQAIASYAPELRLGRVPPSKPIQISGVTIAEPGRTLLRGKDMNDCLITGSECWISVETQIQCTPNSVGADCSLAYRIKSLRSQVTGFGTTHDGPFVPADFTVPLSFELTQRVEDDQCDPSTELFASGINKSTGQVICLQKPTRTCQKGEISKGLVYNSSNASLEPLCEQTPTLTCPQHYALLNLQLSSLQPGNSKNGTCVVVTKKQVPWKTTPAPAVSVSGKYCPTNYKTKATCQLTNVVQSNGSCDYSCNCAPNAAGVVQCSTCTCNVSPVPGSVTITDGTQNASCSVQVPAQPSCSCGAQASWKANAQLTGVCNLDESQLPETRPL
jgi:hypothetical protein